MALFGTTATPSTGKIFPVVSPIPGSTTAAAPVTRGTPAPASAPVNAPRTRTGGGTTDLANVGKFTQPITTPGFDPVSDQLSQRTGGVNGQIGAPPAGDGTGGTGTGGGGGGGAGGTSTAPTSSLLAEPGAYENWIKANSGRLDTPTNIENLYNSGVGQNLTNTTLSTMGPIATGGYDIGPSASAGNTSSILGSLSGGPSGGPSAGASSGILGSLSGGPSGGPSAGSSAGVLAGLDTGPSLATRVYLDVNGQLASQGAAEQKYDQIGKSFDDPGAYEQWYAQHGDEPNSKSYTETLYESGLGQLDPYYDYAEKRALEAAQRASAARGGFNSGLAAQQESDITSNLRGQQAQRWVDLAPQADEAARLRRAQGSDFARTASDEYADRINNAYNLADKAQEAQRSRLDTLSGVAARGDAGDTARANTRVAAAGNADDAAIGAFSAEWTARNAAEGNRVNAAGNADQASIGAYNAEWNARNNAEQNRITASNNADNVALRQYEAEQQAKYNSGQLSLQQYQANIDLARAQSSENRLNTGALYDMASAADASSMGRFSAQADLQRDLQTTGQNRILGGLGAITDQSSREADLAARIYNDMSSINTLDDVSLQALADKYGIKLQQLKDAVSAGGDVLASLTRILGGA